MRKKQMLFAGVLLGILLFVAVILIVMISDSVTKKKQEGPAQITEITEPKEDARPTLPKPVEQSEEPIVEQHEKPIVELEIEIIHPEKEEVRDEVPQTEPDNETPGSVNEPSEITSELQALVDNSFAQMDGTWGVLIEGLNRDVKAGLNTEEMMVSASVIKLFIMATVYDRIEEEVLDHDVVYPLVHAMITISDNYSTNSLIKILGDNDSQAGMDVVNQYAASIGCVNSRLNRLMLENNGLQNYVSAADCAKVLKMIYNGTCVSEAWSEEMLQIMQEQTVRNRIPSGLPYDVVCANKTGDLIGICCADVGIIFSETADYVICLICNQPTNDYETASIMADFSRSVYDWMNKNN